MLDGLVKAAKEACEAWDNYHVTNKNQDKWVYRFQVFAAKMRNLKKAVAEVQDDTAN